jgi:hypothetical protein
MAIISQAGSWHRRHDDQDGGVWEARSGFSAEVPRRARDL